MVGAWDAEIMGQFGGFIGRALVSIEMTVGTLLRVVPVHTRTNQVTTKKMLVGVAMIRLSCFR